MPLVTVMLRRNIRIERLFCPLLQVGKKGGRSYERMFYLFSDMLMYAKPRMHLDAGAGAYQCCCILPLQHCTVNKVLGQGQEAALFSVSAHDHRM